ncbi:capsular polysaccharide biosynthesis protein [Rhabdobacter roseus]|uniref:protein-tyrosine-phosphatase n=1 Tax=Rhabdobacter roseus TaxID=1655419 RepID=A0A840TMU3_9BACT|nr:CpsB/CapC family capsule biosynthesis tyrosine phosphatase [Rhabdobacter roseus]MBB5284704.1 tyrosine-protein phosphatase YwqE [Rhabdobacter roseus]
MLNWLFGKKKTALDLSHITTDLHSHLIPGIDDGVQTLDESVAMIERYQELGYRRVITTPHVIWDCYKNTPEIILEGLEAVRAACQQVGLSVELGAAAEYFIDEHFVEMLQGGQKLLTLPGNRLLVELPYSTPLLNTSETLFSILQHGYRPVLAHPERYTYFYADPSIYHKLANQGCELQVNALSLTGYYGEGIHKMADWLLREGLITFLGTDAHRMQHLELLRKAQKSPWLMKYPFMNSSLPT